MILVACKAFDLHKRSPVRFHLHCFGPDLGVSLRLESAFVFFLRTRTENIHQTTKRKQEVQVLSCCLDCLQGSTKWSIWKTPTV